MVKVDPVYAYTSQKAFPKIVGSPGGATMVRLTPLSGPLTAGLELLILILYPVPPGTVPGIVAVIGLTAVDVIVPKTYVVPAKLPVASESSAVKTLLKPVFVKLQFLVNVMLNELFKQNDVPVNVGAESVGALIVMFEPFTLPVIAGFELTILTR